LVCSREKLDKLYKRQRLLLFNVFGTVALSAPLLYLAILSYKMAKLSETTLSGAAYDLINSLATARTSLAVTAIVFLVSWGVFSWVHYHVEKSARRALYDIPSIMYLIGIVVTLMLLVNVSSHSTLTTAVLYNISSNHPVNLTWFDAKIGEEARVAVMNALAMSKIAIASIIVGAVYYVFNSLGNLRKTMAEIEECSFEI